MNKREFLIGLQILLISSSGFTYQVKPGDTLSSIAYKQGKTPVFGPKGSLAKILKLNPAIKNPDLIFVGQELVLEKESIARSSPEIPGSDLAVSKDRTPAVEATETQTAAANSDVEMTFTTSTTALKEESSVLKEESSVANPPTPALATQESEHQTSEVGAQFESSFFRFDGRDDSNGGASATFFSEISPGLSLFWNQNFSSSWQGDLKLNLYSLQMQKFARRSFANDKINLSSISYDLRYRFKESGFSFGLQGGYAQHAFVRSVDTQTLEVLRILSPQLSAGIEWAFFNIGRFKGTALGGAGLIAASRQNEFSTESGNYYYGGLKLSQTLRFGDLEAGLQHIKSKQSSDLLGTLERTQLLFDVGYSWDLE